MIIAGIDTETTGINSDEHEIVEIGIYICEHKFPEIPIYSCSAIFKTDKWDMSAQDIHQISMDISKKGIRIRDFDLVGILDQYTPDYIIAHSAEFDYKFVTKQWPGVDKTRYNWLCSDHDLPHNSIVGKTSSSRLMHLAVDYGIPVSSWHRALDDAKMVCNIASHHDLTEAWHARSQPKFSVEAWGTYDIAHKEKLKKVGFRWNPDSRRWFRNGLVFEELERAVDLVLEGDGWDATVTDDPSGVY